MLMVENENKFKKGVIRMLTFFEEMLLQIMFELVKIVGTLECVGSIFLVERNEYFNF